MCPPSLAPLHFTFVFLNDVLFDVFEICINGITLYVFSCHLPFLYSIVSLRLIISGICGSNSIILLLELFSCRIIQKLNSLQFMNVSGGSCCCCGYRIHCCNYSGAFVQDFLWDPHLAVGLPGVR